MPSPAERYEIIDVFGSPSEHAIVGRGRDLPTGDEFAVKMRRPGAQVERRFNREVEAMQAAAGAHVMPVVEVDPDGEWYSMPIASGELTERAHRLGHEESAALAVAVVRAVADGLRAFHDAGRVHRDLKPQNILWLEDAAGGRWVVSDFGIARNAPGTTTAELTRDGHLVGTERWAAPEQHSTAHSATPRTDIYSLGAIVGWIMTGDLPSAVHVPLPAQRFRSVVARATRLNPEARYQDVDEMLLAMEREAEGSSGPLSAQLDLLLAQPDAVQPLNDFALAHRDNANLMLPELSRIDQALIRRWSAADPGGLELFAESMCDHLSSGDTGGLSTSGLRPPLFWALNVLRLLVGQRRLELAERLAISFFRAAESCNQFPVGDEIARWLKGLTNAGAVQAMLHAISASGTDDYIRSLLQHDWGKPSSDVLRRWML